MRNDNYGLALAAGLLSLLVALKLWINDWHFLKNNARATAIVAEIKQRKSNYGEVSYTPVYVFTPPGGATQFIEGFSSSDRTTYQTGQKATVIYDPENPERAKIWSELSLFGTATVYIAIGLSLLMLGGGYYTSWLLVGRRYAYYW